MAFPDPSAGITRISLQNSGLILFYSATTIINQVKKTGYVKMSADFQNLVFADTDGTTFTVPSLKITQVDTPKGIWTYSTIDNATQATSSDDIATRTQSIFETLAKYVFIACCDSDCDCGGDGCYSATNTYANWELARIGGFLPQGCWIRVTDIPSQPSAVFALFCTSTTEVSLGGRGTFLNADWQNVGDYSGVFAITGVAFTANVGQWYVGLEGTAVDGDVVIWNCLHYQVVDAASFAGTDPATNTTAYTLLPKSTANTGYISEVDDIEFDFPSDWLQYRADKRGNTYRYSQVTDSFFSLGYTVIDLFQWGRDAQVNNSIVNGYLDIINVVGTVSSQYMSPYSKAETLTISSSGNVSGNIMKTFSVVSNMNIINGSFSENDIHSLSLIDGITIDDARVVSGNEFGDESVFQNCLFTINGDFKHSVIGAGNSFIDKVVEQSFAGNSIEVNQVFPETIVSAIDNTTHVPGSSTQSRDLDITGLTSVDIGTNAELVGIYNLTSGNATETISDFSNFPTLFPFTIRPAAGLIVTLTITPVASISAPGEIVDASATIVLDGDNGDEATMQVQSIGGFDVLVVTEVVQML